MEAALHGSREIGFTIVSMTMSLAAVFIPVLFMGGILGRLFREFAVTICTAILISGHGVHHADADAVQPLPAIRHAASRSAGCSYRVTEAFFDGMLARLRMEPALGSASPLRDGWSFSSSSWSPPSICISEVPKGFIPDTDNDSAQRQRRSRAGHFVLPDGRVHEARRGHRATRSQRRILHVQRRRQLRRHGSQHSRMYRATEAAPAAQADRHAK